MDKKQPHRRREYSHHEIIDIRKPKPFEDLHFFSGEIYAVTTPRVAVLGTDCAVGKRTTCRMTLEMCRADGIATEMIYTGQTGWLQGYPYGFILDATPNDFVSGEIEHAVVAEEAAAVLRPGDIAWVQDYQLQLVPGMLRRLRSDVTIGFYLHIPFPPIELFSRLPWRRQIIEGLLGADVLAFQTRASVANFARAARRFLAAGGGHHNVAGARQVAGHQFAVFLQVVHRQDEARL